MNRTQIEWAKNPDGSPGYTWNPITGCLNHDNGLCKGGNFPCYAYKLANGRLKPLYLANLHRIPFVPSIPAANILNPFYPRFWGERLTPLHIPRKANSPKKGIFVCDMAELFGDWIPQSWQEQVFNAIKANPDYRFYLLTKQPQNLIKFSPFPDNCWVGVTATNPSMFADACHRLKRVQASVKYISLEPLLDFSPDGAVIDWQRWIRTWLNEAVISWLIIGACTGTLNDMQLLRQQDGYSDLCVKYYHDKVWTAQPKIEWVREIVQAADKARVKVFLKDNLKPLLINYYAAGSVPQLLRLDEEGGLFLRQELPE